MLALGLTVGLVATASAGPSKGTGGGKSGTTTIGVTAIDGTAQTPDMGMFTYNNTSRASYTAGIDCVRVEGNTTYFSGVIRVASRIARSMFGILPGFTYVYGELVDGGEPATDSFELLLLSPDGEEDPAAYCQTDRDGTVHSLTAGNLQVR